MGKDADTEVGHRSQEHGARKVRDQRPDVRAQGDRPALPLAQMWYHETPRSPRLSRSDKAHRASFRVPPSGASESRLPFGSGKEPPSMHRRARESRGSPLRSPSGEAATPTHWRRRPGLGMVPDFRFRASTATPTHRRRRPGVRGWSHSCPVSGQRSDPSSQAPKAGGVGVSPTPPSREVGRGNYNAKTTTSPILRRVHGAIRSARTREHGRRP